MVNFASKLWVNSYTICDFVEADEWFWATFEHTPTWANSTFDQLFFSFPLYVRSMAKYDLLSFVFYYNDEYI